MKDEITCVTIISQQTLLNALQRKQSTPTRLEGEKHAVITKQIFPAEPQSAEFRAEIRLDREGGEKKKKNTKLAQLCELTDSEEIFFKSSGPGFPTSSMINFN